MEARQATLGPITPARDTTIIYGIDYDGCFDAYALWLNPQLDDLLKEHGLTRKKWLHHLLENSPFGKALLETARDPKTKRIIFTSASNRQSLLLDAFNRLGNFDEKDKFENGSAFAFIEQLTEATREFLHEKSITDVAIEGCMRTMEDIWYGLDTGTEYGRRADLDYPLDFQNVKEELEKIHYTLHEKGDYNPADPANPTPYFDHSKISMIYAQCHAFADQYPGEKLAYRFYDDRPEICLSVYHAFKMYSDLLPRNITLQVYHHDTYSTSFNPTSILDKQPTPSLNLGLLQKHSGQAGHFAKPRLEYVAFPFEMIQGTGLEDLNYELNVVSLHHCLKAIDFVGPGWRSIREEGHIVDFNKKLRAADGKAHTAHIVMQQKGFDYLFGEKSILNISLKQFCKDVGLAHSRGISRTSTPGPTPTSP